MHSGYSWLSWQVIDAQYSLVLAELEHSAFDLLGIKFRDGSRNYQTHVGARFIWIDRFHLERDYRSRDAEILKLRFLFKHLYELRLLHPEAYRRARKMIRKAPNEAQYFGARMEVYVAASLARSSISFACRESPDYELMGLHAGVLLECGSAHVVKKDGNAAKKLSMAVANKCKKPYAKRNVALCLDATNPIHHAIEVEWPLDVATIRKSVGDAIANKGYGSVLLMSYGLNSSMSEIAANYIRVDAADIDPRLLALMDEKFPFGRSARSVTFFPDQG